MIRALLLIFDPVGAWERVIEAKRGVMMVILLSVLPLLLLVTAVEGYGLVHWGKQQGEFGKPALLAVSAAVQHGIYQIVLSLVVIFLGAFMVKAIGETFHGRHDYLQAFTTVAYGLTPYFMVRMLDAIPYEPWWLTWAVGCVLALSTLYTGIPYVMKPDPTHALGLYFMSALVLIIITGLAAFAGYMILQQHLRVTLLLPGSAAGFGIA